MNNHTKPTTAVRNEANMLIRYVKSLWERYFKKLKEANTKSRHIQNHMKK